MWLIWLAVNRKEKSTDDGRVRGPKPSVLAGLLRPGKA